MRHISVILIAVVSLAAALAHAGSREDSNSYHLATPFTAEVSWVPQREGMVESRVTDAENPEVLALLYEIADRLRPAWLELLGPDVDAQLAFTLTDKTVWNFNVKNQVSAGMAGRIDLQTRILLTYGTLRVINDLAKANTNNEADRKIYFLKRLTSIIQHEMGHTIDHVEVFRRDGNTDDAQYSIKRTRAIEFKADSNGELIGLKSGLGRGLIHDTVVAFSESSSSKSKFFKPTLPEGYERALLLRINGTKDRIEFGENIDKGFFPSLAAKGWDAEMQKSLAIPPDPLPPTLPEYRRWLTQQIEQAINTAAGPTLRKPGLEWPRFTEMILQIESSRALTKEEFDEAYAIFQQLLGTTEYLTLVGRNIAGDLTGRQDQILEHQLMLVNELHFFRDPRVVDLVSQHFNLTAEPPDVGHHAEEFKVSETARRMGSLLEALEASRYIVNNDAIWDHFLPVFKSRLAGLKDSQTAVFKIGQALRTFRYGMETTAKIMAVVETDLPSMDSIQELSFWQPILWPSETLQKELKAAAILARNGKLQEPDLSSYNQIMKYYHEAWRLRGLLETEAVVIKPASSYPEDRPSIDWQFVAEWVGVDRSQVNNLVIQAMNDYLKVDGGRRLGRPNFGDQLRLVRERSIFAKNENRKSPYKISPYTTSLLLGSRPESQLAQDPTGRELVREALLQAFQTLPPHSSDRLVNELLPQAANVDPAAQDTGVGPILQEMRELFTKIRGNQMTDKADTSSILKRAINKLDSLHLPLESQKKAYREVGATFLQQIKVNSGADLDEPHSHYKSNVSSIQFNAATELMYILLAKGAISRGDEIVELNPARHENDWATYYEKNYKQVFVDLKKDLREGRFQDYGFFETQLDRFLKSTNTWDSKMPGPGNELITYFARKERFTRIKSAFVTTALDAGFGSEKMEPLFWRLSENSPTRATDALFVRYVLPTLAKRADRVELLKKAVLEKRLRDPQLILDVARDGFAVDIERNRIGSDTVDASSIDELLKNLKQSLPQNVASSKFLDDIAWRLDLSEFQLETITKMSSSTGETQEITPEISAMIAYLGAKLEVLSPNEREQFIRFIIGKRDSHDVTAEPLAMPEALWSSIVRAEKTAIQHLMAVPRFGGKKLVGNGVSGVSAGTLALREWIESWVDGASELEAIPFVDYTLNAGGKSSIMNNPEALSRMIERDAAIEGGSLQDRLLRTYLKVAPSYMRSVSFAYMLAQKRLGGGTSIATTFIAFGRPGIKLGQMMADFGLLPAETAKDLNKLKDQAPPMSRLEFEKQMRRVLPLERFQKMRRTIVRLAAASMKTVAKVHDEDQGEMAIAALSPYGRDQDAANLDLIEKFVAGIKETSSHEHAEFFDQLLAAFKSQIFAEGDLRPELDSLDRVAPLVADLAKEVKGWDVSTLTRKPQMPADAEVVFLKLGTGETLNSLQTSHPEIAAELGPKLLKLTFALMFRHGIFDADRHTGNWLVDVKNRRVYFLDLGQPNILTKTNPWTHDERVTVADFFRGLNDREEATVARSLVQMSEGAKVSEKDLRALVANYFREHPQADNGKAILDVASLAARAGVKFQDRFLIGVMKGSLVLKNNPYASGPEFSKILEEEIYGLYKTKPVSLARVLTDRVRATFSEASKSLFGFTRNAKTTRGVRADFSELIPQPMSLHTMVGELLSGRRRRRKIHDQSRPTRRRVRLHGSRKSAIWRDPAVGSRRVSGSESNGATRRTSHIEGTSRSACGFVVPIPMLPPEVIRIFSDPLEVKPIK